MTTLLTLTTTAGVILVNRDQITMIDPKPDRIDLYICGEPTPLRVTDPWSVIKKHFEVIAFYPNEVK